MNLLVRVVAVCAVFWAADLADAQEAYMSRAPIYAAPGVTPMLATMQARAALHATDLKRAWLAAGHPATSTLPTISSGKILTPTVDVQTAPAAPAISVTFKTGAAGLESIYAYFYPSTSGGSFTEEYSVPYQSKGPTKGTIAMQSGHFSLYAAPGNWTLSYLYIYDQAGNATYYGPSQLASLFPSVAIAVTNNGTTDANPPTVSAGAILTPKVSLSSAHPTFDVSLTLADDVSGVAETVIFLTPPGVSGGCGYNNYPPSPVLSGTITNYGSLACFGTPSTGTWTIDGYLVCDAAGNCLDDQSPADVKALFGKNTFKVID